MNSILKIAGLKTSFGEKGVLNGVNLEVSAGDFHLIIGPNGAGKTTLLRAILAMVPLQAGEIQIMGKRHVELSAHERAHLMGYVPQSLELSFNMSVWDFLGLARFAYQDTLREREQAIEHSMLLTQIAHLRDAYFNELSGGERQRVLIAGALAQNPKILVLDEPGSSLDPGHRLELVRLLRKLHLEANLTILLVTHDWNEYAYLNPSVIALKDGKVAFQSEFPDLKNRISELYQCEFQHFLHNGIWYSLPDDQVQGD